MKEFQEKQKEAFNNFFQRQKIDLINESTALQIEFDILSDFIGMKKEKNILDLGCGMGRNSIKLAMSDKTCQVVGIDISPVAINIANELAEKFHTKNFKAILSDFKELQRDYVEKFDFVLLVNMLHHTDQPKIILENIHRALKNDGSLIILENNPLNPLFIPFFIMIGALRAHLNMQYLKSNRLSLNKTLRLTGFRVTSLKRHGYLPTMLYNYSLLFKKFNDFANKIPFLNEFCAFYLIRASKVS